MLVAPVLETQRLVLTPLRTEDAAFMVSVLANERMYGFTGGHPPTLAELQARYGRLREGRSADGSEWWFNWIVRLGEDATPVGALQATMAADGLTSDVAWEIGVDWQGRGIASEAATEVVRWLTEQGVEVVRALIHPEHVASGRVAERAGLVRTTDLDDGEVVWMITKV